MLVKYIRKLEWHIWVYELCSKIEVTFYLFINICFPFKVIPLTYNALMPMPFPILETLLTCSPSGMTLSSSDDAVFISSIVAKLRPFIGLFGVGNRKKSQEDKSGEHDCWGSIAILFLTAQLWKNLVKVWQFRNEFRRHTFHVQSIRKNYMTRSIDILAWAEMN